MISLKPGLNYRDIWPSRLLPPTKGLFRTAGPVIPPSPRRGMTLGQTAAD